jgi:GTP1/Obg family GTP-binding protein
MTDNEKIAALTSDAIRVSGEKVIKDLLATVDAAEHTAKMLREEAEKLVEEIKKRTDKFADRVSSYVENCQSAIDTFQAHQLKIFEMDNLPKIDEELDLVTLAGGKIPPRPEASVPFRKS